MTLKIMDWDGEITDTGVCLDDIENSNILRIDISVVTGDEIATVVYTDGEQEEFDSSNCRDRDYFDNKYALYVKGKVNNIEAFNLRKNSYWR